MQATVRSFDPISRSGSVLLDDGTELSYDERASAAGSVRLLRPGQRVRIEVAQAEVAPRVTYLTISTLPDRRSSRDA